jgi:hypothetical protein
MVRSRSLSGTFSFMADSGSKSPQSTLNPSLHHERNQARFKCQPWRRRIRRVLLGILLLTLFFYGICGFRRLDTKEYKREDKWMRPSHCSYFVEDCETTASFIFDSVHSLLKQWPNTFAPNGHSIVTATVPPNTQLYHAKVWSGTPKKPTFFALNA